MARTRVPELVEKLSAQASVIAEIQRDYAKSKQRAQLEVGQAEVVLRSLKRKVGRPVSPTVKVALSEVKKYKRSQRSDTLWNVYVELNKVVLDLEEHQSDLAWER